MEWVNLVLLIIAVILLTINIVILLKRKDNANIPDIKEEIKKANDDQEKRILDDNNRLKNDVKEIQINTNKELSEFKEKMTASLNERFDAINKNLSEGILNITKEMNKNVSENFEKTNETFSNIRERIAKIDEAQKSLQSVETSIDSFKEILENKKLRGNYGEFQLEAILEDVFGQKPEIYAFQYQLSNNTKADAILFLPDPLGKIVIDSKFPLDNYKKMYDTELPQAEREQFKRLFKNDVKKHIDDIKSKYIIKGETSEQAMMFIPSEAIFAEINGNYTELIEYSRKNKVWMASPTTLMAVLETVQLALRDIELKNNTEKILQELIKLEQEFVRYEKRWNNFNSHLSQMTKDAEEISVTTKKITNRFKEINKTSDQIEYSDDPNSEEVL